MRVGATGKGEGREERERPSQWNQHAVVVPAPEPITEGEAGTAGPSHHKQPPGLSVSVPAAPIAAVPPRALTPRVCVACPLQTSR